MIDWLNLFKELCETPGVSGFEEEVAGIVKKNLKESLDHVESDQMGNVFGLQSNSSTPEAPVIMIAAHMDEVGLIVKYIEKDGFLRVQRLGEPGENVLIGQRVVVCGNKGHVVGLIGQKPVHLLSDSERRIVPHLADLYVDIGTGTRNETEELGVEIGTTITFDRKLCDIGRGFVTGKAIDNRAGVSIMLRSAKELSKKNLESTIYYVGTVREEVGYAGAKAAVARVEPDVVLVLDGLHAGGTPDVSERELPLRLGLGPAITIAGSGRGESDIFIANRKLRNHIVNIAENNGIPLQPNIGIDSGLSDAGAIHCTGKGPATSDILVVRRYSHSPIEMASLSDIENAIRLVCALVPQIDRSFVATLNSS
jgi:endoglucanase